VRLFFGPFLIVHLATPCYMDVHLGFTPPNQPRHAYVPLNPKWTSIPSAVVRKGLKKSVGFDSSLFLIAYRLRHKTAFYGHIQLGARFSWKAVKVLATKGHGMNRCPEGSGEPLGCAFAFGRHFRAVFPLIRVELRHGHRGKRGIWGG